MNQTLRWSWLVLIPGCLVSSRPLWASPVCVSHGPVAFVRSLSHGFFLHNSQGYLGVDVGNIDDKTAADLKLKDRHGAEVIAVDHDAPAAKAGLMVHDIILEMNGDEIASSDQLRGLLRNQAAGQKVTFAVERGVSTLNITVVLADRSQLEQQAWLHHFSVPDPAETSAPTGQGFAPAPSQPGSHLLGLLPSSGLYVGADVNPLRAQLANYFGVNDGTGLLVENVESSSPASLAGLRAGDVILKVNATPMKSRSDWRKAIRGNRGKFVHVTILRNKHQQLLTMAAGTPRGQN